MQNSTTVRIESHNNHLPSQWALLRAIFANKSSATSSRLIRKLNYKINQNNIVLDYTLRDSKQPLDKSLFVQFSLPKQL
ncbi:hypothetical protein PWW31_29375 [Vibrio harveyi]|nr:hypothetical protein PWW31_29375 [Vibrio harveyi]